MIDDRSFEDLLERSLEQRGEPAPFAVDVAHRVMARVAELGPPRRVEVRYFARWAAAAAVAGLALLALAVWKGPSFNEIVDTLGLTTAGWAGVGQKLIAPANAIAAAAGRIGTALVGTAQSVVQPLVAFQPLVRALIVLLTAGMLATTTFIVGRDVRARVADQENA